MFDAQIVQKIREDSETVYAPGATETQIAEMCAEVGVPLPNSYLEFLQEFNGGEFNRIRMHRIGEHDLDVKSGNPLDDYFGDVVGGFKATNGYVPGVAEGTLFPFGDDWGGNFYCFEVTKMQNGECPIVQFQHEYVEPTFTFAANNLTELFRQAYQPQT